MARVSKRDKTPRRALALGDTAMATIVERDTGVDLTKGFRLTVNGLYPQGQPTFAESAKAGEILRVAQRADGFAIGGWANYVEQRFGEEAAQMIDAESGWNLKTLSVYQWMDKQIAPERRRMDRLTIKHHLLVAALSAAKQKLWLDRAANDDGDEPWTSTQLRDAIVKNEEELSEQAFWVITMAKNEQDANGLVASMQAQGRTAKLKVGRQRAKES